MQIQNGTLEHMDLSPIVSDFFYPKVWRDNFSMAFFCFLEKAGWMTTVPFLLEFYLKPQAILKNAICYIIFTS
jgi:hypothetical protein